jgi:radical SAM superfamily enzyme YgiQ (UPF0313 family)
VNSAIPQAGKPHLLLVTIDEQVRPVSIRVLGAYAESIGLRTTLLVILRRLAKFGDPVTFSSGEIQQVAALLEREQVTHLGFYLMTASLKPCRLLVAGLRSAGFKGVVLTGGVHASLCPEEALADGVDFAVQGPGERPLEAIVRGDPPERIPGLVWRKDGRTVINPVGRDSKVNLDDLPFPLFRFDRDWVLVHGRIRPLTWKIHERYGGWHGRYYDLVTSRGCAYRCAYCCNVDGAPVRRASVDRVIRELQHVKEVAPGIKGVNIQDDSFYIGSDDWVNEFCRRMKEEVGLPFIVRMIPRYVTPERLARLKEAGLQYVTMGLQSSSRINRSVFNRHETSDSFVKAARTVLAANLWLSIDLIIHNPYEQEEDLREIAFALNALPRPNWWLVPLSLTPFPGTPLRKRCEKDGFLDRFSTDPYDAMLNPSKPGGYLTPRFWLTLNTVVLPRVNPQMGAQIITLGSRDPKAVQMVESLGRWIKTTQRMTQWLRDETPFLYGCVYRTLRLFARGSAVPGETQTV